MKSWVPDGASTNREKAELGEFDLFAACKLPSRKLLLVHICNLTYCEGIHDQIGITTKESSPVDNLLGVSAEWKLLTSVSSSTREY